MNIITKILKVIATIMNILYIPLSGVGIFLSMVYIPETGYRMELFYSFCQPLVPIVTLIALYLKSSKWLKIVVPIAVILNVALVVFTCVENLSFVFMPIINFIALGLSQKKEQAKVGIKDNPHEN